MNTPASTLRIRVQWAGLFAGPVLAAVSYTLLPGEYVNAAGDAIDFTHAGRATVALMVWMATWWITEAIHISATALLPIVVLPIAGATAVGQATSPYATDLIFLFMGGFILALSMQRWGLDKRIALITIRIVGTRPHRMIAGFMIATATLSAFVSNTATTAMMLPVALSVIALVMQNDQQADARSSNFAIALMLGIAYAASIGGVATIIGSPPNVFLVGYVRDMIDPAFRTEITFIKWMAIGTPLAIVFLPITWLLLTRVLYPIRMNAIEGGRDFIQSAHRDLGPMKRGEWITMTVFFCAAFLWIVRPIIANGWSVGEGDEMRYLIPPLVPGLRDAGVAMLAAMALFVIPVEPRTRTFTMNWQHAVKLPWGILILFGGGLSLAAAMEINGVTEFIGAQTRQFAGMSPLLIVVIVIAAAVLVSHLASNTVTATTLVPILAAVAPALGMHPYVLIVPAAIAASCAFALPVATPPNAIVFASGHITMPQMVRAGLWLNVIGIVLITALAYAVVMRVLGV